MRCLALATWLLLSAAMASAQEADPPRSKKGLQVQMVDDALALGIAHATLNVQLGHLVERLDEDGRPVLREASLRALDAQVRPLAAAGVELNFILLARATGRAEIDALQFDPRYDARAPNQLGAFRVLDEAGQRYLRAVLTQLADRYGPGSEVGRVRGWIVGNEVNSHWWWYNLGRAELKDVVAAYEPAVRLVHEVVAARDADARVYVSLEHHWQARFAAGDAEQACSGRVLLDAFAARAREGGDFPWHVAFHPYPENLFDCRFWEDTTARAEVTTPRITFKNLEVLTDYLTRTELQWQGQPRRVILSEQGFHCRDDPTGERDQAAAFALAWRKVESLPGIDAFIYHRHVDHAHEGGLRFGLYENRPGSVADPGRKRLIWELLRVCDTPVGGRVLGQVIAQMQADADED
ncbi:MAG: hypothetical protein CMJ94_09610 [Planctomycetes bacterium]|nr:hypothetical protein [Planctomycetota bacterium]